MAAALAWRPRPASLSGLRLSPAAGPTVTGRGHAVTARAARASGAGYADSESPVPVTPAGRAGRALRLATVT
jgi:hypothetical protein